MPNKKQIGCAHPAWGPIENPIDKETLDLWRRLDPESHGRFAISSEPTDTDSAVGEAEEVPADEDE